MTATTAVTEEEAGAKAEAEAEVESEALREREAIHELRVLLESDGVLLPPRYDDEELLRFLQTTRPPLLAAAAVGPVADDIRWRAARGGDAESAEAHFRSAMNEARTARAYVLEIIAAREWQRHVLEAAGRAAEADAVIDTACGRMGKERAAFGTLLA